MNVVATLAVPKAAMVAPAPAPAPPSQLEQEHVQQALEASQTAMDAIGTVTNLATYTLTILGIILGLVAIVGGVAIWRAARATAKQIANKRFDTYIMTDEFKELVRVKIEQSVQDRWQDTVVVRRLSEELKPADDPSPFPPGDAK